MRTLRVSEAAAYLNVSPSTLRAWEERFGFPVPQRSPGHHRLYAFRELVALREALSNGLPVSSAVTDARDATEADEYTLTAALLDFNYSAADRAMELGLSLRTFESAVMRLMLPALREIAIKVGTDSAPWSFASRWAEEWLGRAARLAAGPDGPRVLFADCVGTRGDLEGIYARVLEVFCVRAGAQALRLQVSASRGLERVTASFQPEVLVSCGRGAPEAHVVAFARFVRCRVEGVRCVSFRGLEETPPTSQALSPSPLRAREQILSQPHPGQLPLGRLSNAVASRANAV